MSTNANEFDDFVQRLREVFFALRAVSEELLSDLDCTAAERGVLQDLDKRGPQTVPAMAQERAVSRQAMQKTVDRLIDRNWLRPEPNPRHQRSMLVVLTPAGSRLFSEIRSRERRLLPASDLPLSDAELRRTTRALQEIGEFFANRRGQR